MFPCHPHQPVFFSVTEKQQQMADTQPHPRPQTFSALLVQEGEQKQAPPQPTKLHPFSLDALYCSEKPWDEEDDDGEDEGLVNPSPILLDQDLLWEDQELVSLLSKEQTNSNVDNDASLVSLLANARCEAVEWILKVHAHYDFSALTAVLAVNYLDRFLGSFRLQEDKPWMTQLTAVACISLAAKVEETQVPLLLDFQVEDSSFIFEAKTIQRMELLVLSSLQWKMNPVTPLSFLDYIARRLGLKGHLCWEFLRRCEHILLSVISDCRFMCYLPSVMGASTMLHVINDLRPHLGIEEQTQLLRILGMDMEKIDACYQLILEYASKGHKCLSNKRKFGSAPGSPRGVMEMCFSSDSSNDSWSVGASASSSPEPLSKKTRAGGDISGG